MINQSIGLRRKGTNKEDRAKAHHAVYRVAAANESALTFDCLQGEAASALTDKGSCIKDVALCGKWDSATYHMYHCSCVKSVVLCEVHVWVT